ncbi:SUKH-3 domain-containing protein [uncultured Clostridium sp.]|uniref:SUKH-3 domain-containing protein n=1 Tax=uncultured Clostridium sp. TaxID=59620 RepID=UPI00262E173F|nr:SUKH-3 domain-containing protein [uncultured Clostridium sp.]
MRMETKEILSKSGWYSGRKINIKHFIKYYEDAGMEVFESVKKFLEEFGDLEINIKIHTLKFGENIYKAYFNPIHFKWGYDTDLDIEEFIKEKFLVVGDMQNNMYKVIIGESGKVYFDDGLISENIDDALDIICLKQDDKLILFENLVYIN